MDLKKNFLRPLKNISLKKLGFLEKAWIFKKNIPKALEKREFKTRIPEALEKRGFKKNFRPLKKRGHLSPLRNVD